MKALARAAGLFLMLIVAGCGTRQEVASTPPPHTASGRGTAPSREEIARVMTSRSLVDAMRACGLWGDVYVQVDFRGSDGAVVEASPARNFREQDSIRRVAPEDADPPLDPTMWACAERALLQLRISPFGQPSFRVSLPVRIQ